MEYIKSLKPTKVPSFKDIEVFFNPEPNPDHNPEPNPKPIPPLIVISNPIDPEAPIDPKSFFKIFEDGWKVTNMAKEILKKEIDEYNSTWKPENKLNIEKYLKLNEEHVRTCFAAVNTLSLTPHSLYTKASSIIQNLNNLKENRGLYIICIRMMALQIIEGLKNAHHTKRNVLYFKTCLIKLIDGSHPGFVDYVMFEITKAFPILIGMVYSAEATKEELGYRSNEKHEDFDQRLSAYANFFYLMSVLNLKSEISLMIKDEDEEMQEIDSERIKLATRLKNLSDKKMNDYEWIYWMSLSLLIVQKNINACTATVLLGALDTISYFDKEFHNELIEIATPICNLIIPELKVAVTKLDRFQGADLKIKLILLTKWGKVASGNFEVFKTALEEAKEREKRYMELIMEDENI